VKQLIYRQTRENPFEIAAKDGFEFVFASRPLHLRHVWRALVRLSGWKGAAIDALKLTSRRRCFYCVGLRGHVVSYGWVNIGACLYYEVAGRDCVIGPIWTAESMRGQGVAGWALKQAMNGLIHRGHQVFFIDTSEDNSACIRVIERCDFGVSTGMYERSSAYEPGRLV